MSDNDIRLKESLSALVDGAADELELQRVLKAASEDDELRASWGRYQMARLAMRNELPGAGIDLSESIAAAIADEPAHGRGAERFLKPLMRVAVAASVTVAVIVGVQQYNQLESTGEASPVIADNRTINDSTSPVLPNGQQPIDTAPVSTRMFEPLVLDSLPELDEASRRRLEQQLNELMRRHIERATLQGSQGMLPYARLPEEENQKSE